MLWAEIAAAAVTVAARLPQTVCRQTVASPSILLPSGSSVPSLPRWRGGLRPLSAFLGTYESLLGSLGRGRAKSSSAYPCRARSVAEPGRQRHEPRQRDNISRQSSVALAAWGALGGDTACSPAANCCPPRRLVTTHPKVQLLSREARGSSVQEVFRKGGSQSLDLRLVSGPSVVGSLEHQQVAGHEVTHGNDLTWKGVQMPGSPSATKDGHQEQGSGEPTPATPSAGGNDAASALKKGRSEAMGPQGGNKGALLLNRHLKGCRDISSVAMLVKGAHPFELTDINVAAALEKIATLISRARGRDLKETEHTRTAIQRLTRQLNDQLGVFRPRALALSLHALGRLRESRVFKVAAASARKRLGEFDAQGLADLACASVAVQRPHGELLKAIEAEILRRLAGGASFCRHSLTNLARALTDARLSGGPAMSALLAAAPPLIHSLEGAGLASLARSAASAVPLPGRLMDNLAEECLRRLPKPTSGYIESRPRGKAKEEITVTKEKEREDGGRRIEGEGRRKMVDVSMGLGPQELAIVASAFARAGLGRPDLMERIAVHAEKRLQEFSPQGLSNLSWALTTAAEQGGGRLREGAASRLQSTVVREAIHRGLEGFSPQALSNLCWSAVAAGVREKHNLLDCAAVAALPILRRFSTQELAMMLHAFAKAECLAPKLFSAAAEEAVARGPATFCPHSLSSLSWSFAASRHPEAERVLDAVGCEAARRAAEFSPEGLAKLAWAFATTGLHHQGLFHSISAEALRRSLRDFNPQDLANVAWAFASVGHVDVELFNGLAASSSPMLREFNPQNISNMAWAFAKLRIPCPHLLQRLQRVAVQRANDFTPQGLANLAWAATCSGQLSPELIPAVEAVMLQRLEEFSACELVMTIQAASASLPVPESFLDALASAAVRRLGEFSVNEVHLMAAALEGAGHSGAAELQIASGVAARGGRSLGRQQASFKGQIDSQEDKPSPSHDTPA